MTIMDVLTGADGPVARYDKALRERVDKLLQVRAALGGNLFALATIYAVRSDRRMMWTVAAVCVVYGVFATVLSKRVFGMMDRRLANVGFFIGDTAYVLALLGATHFAAPVFFVMPLIILFYDGFGEGDTRPFVLAMLGIFAVVPLVFGAPAVLVAVAVGTGALIHWFSEARALTLRLTLVDLRNQTDLLGFANELLVAGNAELSENDEALRAARARTVQSEKLAAIGQLAAGLAHEINNPLAVILGFAQGLERRVDSSSPHHMAIASIVRESLRCKSLVQELLTFARTNGRVVEVVDVGGLMTGTVQLLNSRAKKQDTRLELDIEVDLPVLSASRTGIQQIIVNLGNNALDAVGSGGEVLVRCRRAGEGWIRLEVADTGMGIPEQVRARIFDPFFTTKEVGKGTGLGLSLVHEIVKQHGGSVEVQSAVGVGTTMTVMLPVCQQRQDGVAIVTTDHVLPNVDTVTPSLQRVPS